MPWHTMMFDPPVDRNFPPLYYLLSGGPLKAVGDGECRAAPPLRRRRYFRHSADLFDRTNLAGWFGAARAARLPRHLTPARVVQSGGPALCLLLLLALLAVRFLQHALASPLSLWPRIAFAIAAAAAFYVHTVALAFVGAMAFFVLSWSPGQSAVAGSGTSAAVALLSMPGVYLLLRVPPTVSANPFYLFSPAHVAYTLWAFASGYSLGPNLIELRLEGVTSVTRNLLTIGPHHESVRDTACTGPVPTVADPAR